MVHEGTLAHSHEALSRRGVYPHGHERVFMCLHSRRMANHDDEWRSLNVGSEWSWMVSGECYSWLFIVVNHDGWPWWTTAVIKPEARKVMMVFGPLLIMCDSGWSWFKPTVINYNGWYCTSGTMSTTVCDSWRRLVAMNGSWWLVVKQRQKWLIAVENGWR